LSAVITDPAGLALFVGFYIESNSIPGLQTGTGGDQSLGAASHAPYEMQVSVAGMSPGTYTYYAIVGHSGSGPWPVASTTNTILPNQRPSATVTTRPGERHRCDRL